MSELEAQMAVERAAEAINGLPVKRRAALAVHFLVCLSRAWDKNHSAGVGGLQRYFVPILRAVNRYIGTTISDIMSMGGGTG
jgi:hypothetical protein